MSLQNDKSNLAHTVVRSLERMASVIAEPVNTTDTSPQRPAMASLSFDGETSGRIEIAADEPFVRLLAGDLMGTDPQSVDAVEKADECLKLLVKEVSGALVPKMAGQRRSCHLSQPTLRSLSTEWDWPNMAVDPRTQLFTALGYVLAARVVEAA
jgi:hypothetical protein